MISGKYQKRLLILLGGAFLYMGGMDFIQGWQSHSWNSVPGEISKLSILESTDGQTVPTVKEFEYTYVISNKRLTGNRVRFGTKPGKAFEKSGEVSDFTIGKKVTVYFNPKDPKISVLKPGVSLASIWQTVVGSFTISFGVILLWAKLALRRLLFGIFLLTVGSGPLFKGGEATLGALTKGEMPPIKSGAATAVGGGMSAMGLSRCSKSLRDLLKQFKAS